MAPTVHVTRDALHTAIDEGISLLNGWSMAEIQLSAVPPPILLARLHCSGERKWTVSNHVLHDEGGDQTLDVRKPG